MSGFVQQVSDLAIAHGGDDAFQIGTSANFAGRHAKMLAKRLGQRLRGRKTVLQRQCGDVGVVVVKQLSRNGLQTQAAQMGSRCFASYGLEDAVKVVGRKSRQARHFMQINRLGVMSFQVANDRSQAAVVMGLHGCLSGAVDLRLDGSTVAGRCWRAKGGCLPVAALQAQGEEGDQFRHECTPGPHALALGLFMRVRID